jgi:anti-anti-sigma factor
LPANVLGIIMNFETKNIEDITIFKLNEKRLDTNISGLVKGEFTLLLKVEGIKKLVIDLGNVESCDSSGLSAILVANRLVNSLNRKMRIAAPSEKVHSLIRITQLDKVLSVCETVEQAVKELNLE